jgi:RND family efflux transporter MFP subunit
MDFVDNQMDKGTGTMVGRALIPNPDLIFTPGLFARLQLPGSGKYEALLLPDSAILFDQSVSFVWVLDEKNRAGYRRVEVGRLYEGLRIIKSGLGPGDRVILAGVQFVRPGTEVQPEEAPIPAGTPGPAPAGKGEPAPAEGPAEGTGGGGVKRP